MKKKVFRDNIGGSSADAISFLEKLPDRFLEVLRLEEIKVYDMGIVGVDISDGMNDLKLNFLYNKIMMEYTGDMNSEPKFDNRLFGYEDINFLLEKIKNILSFRIN